MEYNGNENEVCIICPIHGEFWQTPHNHLSGSGCHNCGLEKNIKEEKLFYILKEEFNNCKIFKQKKFNWLKNKLPLSLDFYLPEYNVAIEYQGAQHFKPIEYFGGEKSLKNQIERDLLKIKMCEKHNIKLLHFSFDKNIINTNYILYTDILELINIIKNENNT